MAPGISTAEIPDIVSRIGDAETRGPLGQFLREFPDAPPFFSGKPKVSRTEKRFGFSFLLLSSSSTPKLQRLLTTTTTPKTVIATGTTTTTDTTSLMPLLLLQQQERERDHWWSFRLLLRPGELILRHRYHTLLGFGSYEITVGNQSLFDFFFHCWGLQ